MSNNEMLQKITLGTEATETVTIEVNDIEAEFEDLTNEQHIPTHE